MIDLIVLLIASFVSGILGLIVFLRNPHDITSRLYGLLSLAAILWGIANYFTNHIHGYQAQLFSNKLSLFVGFLLIQAVWLLSLYFPRRISVRKIQRWVSTLIMLSLLVLTLFTNFIVVSVVYKPSEKITNITTGRLFYLYVVSAAIAFIFLTYNFYKTYKSKEVTNVQRQQILYVSGGLILSFLWATLTAVVIPSLTHNWEISKYGAAGALFTVSSFSIAIIRHKLFDIRLVVARSLAYVLSLSTLGGLFTLATFGLTSLLFTNLNTNSIKLLYTVLAVVLAFILQPLKHFFDRATRRLFYRDAYDSQIFLDDLNKILVSTFELNKLLARSAEIIEANLKPSFCLFDISETKNIHHRIIGATKSTYLKESETKDLMKQLTKMNQRLIIVDELEIGQASLQKTLRQNDIAIIAQLSSERTDSGIGHLILGPKKSGNIYSSQDIKIIEIVANELVIATQNALRFEEIKNFNITLQQKVDDATRKLRHANEKLEALDETKDDFISMASHQLRTPLTSIKGYLSMVLEGDAGKINHTEKEMLGQAFFSSQRMVYLIADLLNISRLKTGKFVIEPTSVNLSDMVAQELDQLEETATSHSLTLTYDKPKTFPDLMIDETKTRQVIMNFIDNAIYYTPANGHINVRLIDTPSTVELRVEDDGIGVPKREQPHLFTKFYRAGNARKARPDGTGLGLFMARKVITAQGGSIVFESQEGKGSTFGFLFNKKKLAELPE